jgi:hypothetical protein
MTRFASILGHAGSPLRPGRKTARNPRSYHLSDATLAQHSAENHPPLRFSGLRIFANGTLTPYPQSAQTP